MKKYIEYETGRTESKTIKAQGEINKITASVAINGNLNNKTLQQVEDIVLNMKQYDSARRMRSRKRLPGLIGNGRSLQALGSRYGRTLKRELPMWRMMTFIPC